METQEVRRPLSGSELSCLKVVSQHGDISPFLHHESDLLRLIELGLVEKVSQVWMPLEMKHERYLLTSLGHQLISKYEQLG